VNIAHPLHLNGHSLSIEEVVSVARDRRPATLAPEALDGIRASRAYVESLAARGAPPVYGINTGYGVFADRPISPEDSAQLARNLIVSHAVGVGDPFPEEIVRAAMLVRANTLALGHSGVRPMIIETLIAMLNAGVHPVVPEQGSLGSSGDLAPLCHLALAFTTDEANRDEESGEAIFGGKKMSGRAAMRAAGIPRVALSAKEGLALNNGATFSAALAALAVADAENLIRHSEIVAAMALEALLGASSSFDERLHRARKQPGQMETAAHLRALIAGSTFVDAAGRVQDPYSLRCVPQILGPARDTLTFVQRWVENEINAATDNPLIFPDPSASSGQATSTGSGQGRPGAMRAISGGNFHGEVLALGMDFLGIALAEVGALAEQQINRLVNDRLSFGLPPMLVSDSATAGLHSGLMMPHYTAVSLALENQTLAHPDSVHSPQRQRAHRRAARPADRRQRHAHFGDRTPDRRAGHGTAPARAPGTALCPGHRRRPRPPPARGPVHRTRPTVAEGHRARLRISAERGDCEGGGGGWKMDVTD
jgi:histidine ammonia-lyase